MDGEENGECGKEEWRGDNTRHTKSSSTRTKFLTREIVYMGCFG